MANKQNGHRTSEMDQEITTIFGSFGPFQFNICAFGFFLSFYTAFNALSTVFYFPTTEYHCLDWPELTNQCSADYRNCSKWNYSFTHFTATATSEWLIICDREWLGSLCQSAFMFGCLFSCPIFGHFSDKHGRLKCIWASIVLEILSGVSCALSGSFEQFIVSRFFQGVASYGRCLTVLLLTMESIGPKYRTIMGILYQTGWTFGYCLLPFLAYIALDFRQLIWMTTLSQLIFLLWLFFIPESARWESTNGRKDQALKIVQKAAMMNAEDQSQIVEKFKIFCQNLENRKEQDQETSITIKQLLTPPIRQITLILSFLWFVVSFTYYGISLNIGNLGKNLFVDFFSSGMIEFLSHIISYLSLRNFGRRPVVTFSYAICGIIFMVLTAIRSISDLPILTTVVAMIGKLIFTSTFEIIYIQAFELFPTVFRQKGVSACALVGRVGSLLAPFVKEMDQLTNPSCSLILFSVLSIISAIFAFFLPETRDMVIPDTVEDMRRFKKKCEKNDANNNQ